MNKIKLSLLTLFILLFNICIVKSQQFIETLDYIYTTGDNAYSTNSGLVTCPGATHRFEVTSVSTYQYIHQYFNELKAAKIAELSDPDLNYSDIEIIGGEDTVRYRFEIPFSNIVNTNNNGNVKFRWNTLDGSIDTETVEFYSSENDILKSDYKYVDWEVNYGFGIDAIEIQINQEGVNCNDNKIELAILDQLNYEARDMSINLVFIYDYKYKWDHDSDEGGSDPTPREEVLIQDVVAKYNFVFSAFSNRDKLIYIPSDHGVSIGEIPSTIPCYKNELLPLSIGVGSCMDNVDLQQSFIWEIVQGDATLSSSTSMNPTLIVSPGSDDIIIKTTSTLAGSLTCGSYSTTDTIERGSISAVLLDANSQQPDESQCLNVSEIYSLVYQWNNQPIPTSDMSYFSHLLVNSPVNIMYNNGRDQEIRAIANGEYELNYRISANGCSGVYMHYPFSVGGDFTIENDCYELHPGYGKVYLTIPQEDTDLLYFDNFSNLYATSIFVTSNSAYIAESNNFPWSLYVDIYENCFNNSTQFRESLSFDYYEADCGIRSNRRNLIVDPQNFSKIILLNKLDNSSSEISIYDFDTEGIENYLENNEITLIGIDGQQYSYDINTSSAIPLPVYSKNSLGLLIYPNPTNDVAHVAFNLVDKQNVRIEVLDLLGKVVYAEDMGQMNTGSQLIDIDASSIGNGLYIFNVYAGNGVISERVSINK